MGMGGLATPPYYCAEGQEGIALSYCMAEPMFISVSNLVNKAKSFASKGEIDDLSNLANSTVWLESGLLDSVVKSLSVKKAQEFYMNFMPATRTSYIHNLSAEHCWITDSYGNDCDYLGSPYINNCNYDAAGALLTAIYGPLAPAVSPLADNIVSFQQALYVPSGSTLKKLSLADTGYAYVPTKCQNLTDGACKLHFAFHGCLMSTIDIGEIFITNSGLNNWAESNKIIVVYPQAVPSNLFPNNPNSCWDWWGYTNQKYATQQGPQIQFIKNIIDDLK